MTEQQHPQKKGRARVWGFVQIFAILAVAGVAVMASQAPDATAAKPASVIRPAANQEQRTVVNLTQPERTTTREVIRATGTINVRGYVDLTPEVSGRITWISDTLRTGGSFRAGDQLLVVEPLDFELALAQAHANVDSARSSLLLQQAQSDAAVQNYSLLHPGKSVPPLVAKKPQIDQAKAQLKAAEAAAEIAALNLSRTTFSLPFDGRITLANAEVGQLLTKGQTFGQAFAYEAVEATVPLSPEDLKKLQPTDLRASLVRTGSDIYPARVARVSAELDPRTRFARLYLAFEDRLTLPPGTFVDVEISGPPLENTFVLPDSAAQINGAVYVVKNGILRTVQPVLRGQTDSGFIVDAFDFADGVVTGPIPGARDGLPVRVAGVSS